ncbi:MAG: hypothetical protein ACYTG5_02105 [Planctomycetota bacterium]|jgi:hypothetical protein
MTSSRTCALHLSLTCLIALPSLSAQRVQLKDALPEGSVAYLSFPDLDSSISELKDMPVGKMWQEGEVQDFFADGLKWLEDRWEEQVAEGNKLYEEGKLPVKPDDLMGLRIKSASVGLTSMSISMPEGATQPVPDMGLYMHVDFGDSAEIWQQLVAIGLGQMQAEAGEQIVQSSSKVGDVEIMTITGVDSPVDMSLNIAFIGDGMLIGSREDETKTIIKNLSSDSKGLSGSSSYKAVAENLSLPGAEAEFYCQPGAVLDLLVGVAEMVSSMPPASADSPGAANEMAIRSMLNPEGIERAFQAMGLRAYESCGSTSTYTGGRSVTRGYTKMNPQLRRGISAYSGSNLDLDFLRWVPKDAVQFSASTMNVGAYYDALVDGLNALNPEMGQMMIGMLGSFEQQLGVSVREDLFGAFGNKFIYWSMPMSGITATPEMAILIEVKDKDRLMKALGVAESMSNGIIELDEIDRRGLKAYQLHVNPPIDNNAMPMNPFDMFTPTFVFESGYMVVGFTTGDVKRTLARLTRDDDPKGDIRSNEEFTPFLEQLPKEGLSSVTFNDWKAQFEGMYQMGTSMLAFLPMTGDVPIDLALLPDAYSLTQHLSGSISWVRDSEGGQEVMTISPWGPEILFGLGFAAGTGAAVMGISQQGK